MSNDPRRGRTPGAVRLDVQVHPGDIPLERLLLQYLKGLGPHGA